MTLIDDDDDSSYGGCIDGGSSGAGDGEGFVRCPTASEPNPMEGLHKIGPPFLTKTFKMVEDPVTDYIISWNLSG